MPHHFAQLLIDAEQPSGPQVGQGFARPGEVKDGAEISLALLDRIFLQFSIGGAVRHLNIADQIFGFIP
jgi:hypothetical protein